MDQATCTSIPDIQNNEDTRHIAIDQVGIKDIRYPVVIQDRAGHQQHTVAIFNMYVNLPQEYKGTHMSRFVEILNENENHITVENFKDMLKKMTSTLTSQSGNIEMTFPYFISKSAPISKVKSLMDYSVSFIGTIDKTKTDVLVKVIVPVTSLCPCSKNISDYGAHNQRSHITAYVRMHNFIWIEELIESIEKVASCELYGLLKRPDEKYVTERAYDNPKFVEDIVRDVAIEFNKDDRIAAYTVESENFESIHNHSAYAKLSFEK